MAAGSFSAGLSGLAAHSTYLSVIGNNLANINTAGYKASVVNFADLVSQSVNGISTNPMQIGLGVTIGSINSVFSQGTPENSGIATNAAIQGNGFFIINNGGNESYTRAGNFSFNSEGYLTTPDGWRVRGYTQLDGNGNILTNGQPTDILVPPGSLREPVASTRFSAQINLKADVPIDAANPEYTMPVKVYDSMGGSHTLNVRFDRTAAGTWTYSVQVDGSQVTGGVAGTPTVLANGTMNFDANGNLTTGAPGFAPIALTTPINWANGATSTGLTWGMADANGTPLVSSFVNASAAGSIQVNGNPAGQVDTVSINAEGKLIATLNGGGTVVVGQLALANFNNAQGLVKMGSNRYGESEASGVANIGVAGTGGRGTVTGSALESSNVDVAQEFTKMILAQRGYQANSRSITTADEVLQETLNMKR